MIGNRLRGFNLLVAAFACNYMPETAKGKALRRAADADAILTAADVSADGQAAIQSADDAAIRTELGLGSIATHADTELDNYDHVIVSFADSPVTCTVGKYYHCDLTDGSIVLNAPALAGLVEGNKIGAKVRVAAGANTVTFEPNAAEQVNAASNFAFDVDEEAHEFEVGAALGQWDITV